MQSLFMFTAINEAHFLFASLTGKRYYLQSLTKYVQFCSKCIMDFTSCEQFNDHFTFKNVELNGNVQHKVYRLPFTVQLLCV